MFEKVIVDALSCLLGVLIFAGVLLLVCSPMIVAVIAIERDNKRIDEGRYDGT